MSPKLSKISSKTKNHCKKCHNQSESDKNSNSDNLTEKQEDPAKSSTTTINDDSKFDDSCSCNNITNNSDTVEIDTSNELNSPNYSQKMFFKYGREFICLLALALTTYATFQNGPPKISRTPIPKPFFSKTSIVQEWPGGHLSAVQTKVSTSELSLVLFYAPWCAESQHAREAYDAVSILFRQEAYFAAVNCWQPAGECRLQYSKVQSWPVLMAYYHQGSAVQYHGSWTKHSLSRFIRSLLNPVKRITTSDDLLNMNVDSDGVVVGYFNKLDYRSKYQIYFHAAIKWLEVDLHQNVQFAVVTGETVKDFEIPDTPLIRMYLWNETLELTTDNLTSNNIIKWVKENIGYVNKWLELPGRKSAMLSSYLNAGPTMIFFTPRDYYYQNNDAYHLLKQIALKYLNCENDIWVQESANYISTRRKENRIKFNDFLSECPKENLLYNQKDSQICYSDKSHISFAAILNNSKYSECINDDNTEYCYNRPNSYSILNNFICKKEKFIKHKHSESFTIHNDYRSPKNLYKKSIKTICKNLLLSKESSGHIYFENEPLVNEENLNGLGCRFNRTLSFLLLDSISYHVIAEQLGIDILEKPKKSTILIVDMINDSTFEMKDDISTTNIVAFIENFHAGTIERKLKVNKNQPKQIDISKTKFSIKDISSDEFQDYIEVSNKTIVVLFYSTQCALCNLLSQTLLIIAKVLEYLQIDFLRVDGERNDFLWEYTMDIYPTLIIFPTKRSETRIFPRSLNATISNVLGFIIANLNSIDRIHALFESCEIAKSSDSSQNYMKTLRTEIDHCINQYLRFWRKLPEIRSAILKRLEILYKMNLISFDINKSCDLEIFRNNIRLFKNIEIPLIENI